MDDLGLKGSGSRFVTRFGSNEAITANQLNGLATGIQSALPSFTLGGDLAISNFSGGTSIVQKKSYNNQSYTTHPFKVSVRSVGDNDYWNIVPGTLNSLIPKGNRENGGSHLITEKPQGDWLVNYTNINSDYKASYIYLEAGPNTGSGFTFPDNNKSGGGYPDVSSYDTTFTDDDASGVILIAVITKSRITGAITIDQMVKTSLYADRRKFTEPDTAQYFVWQA